MQSFSPGGGLLPLSPYEPTGEEDPPTRPNVAEGQLTLDDLLAELNAEHPAPRREPVSAPSRRILHRVMTGLLEVHTGRRPLTQLDAWLTPLVQRRLRAGTPRLDSPRYVLRNIHVCRPAEEALEICATATSHARACAVAARFEHDGNGWRCSSFTVLEPR